MFKKMIDAKSLFDEKLKSNKLMMFIDSEVHSYTSKIVFPSRWPLCFYECFGSVIKFQNNFN